MDSNLNVTSRKANNRKCMDMFYREYFGDDSDVPTHSLPDLNDLFEEDNEPVSEEDETVKYTVEEDTPPEMYSTSDPYTTATHFNQDFNQVYQPVYIYDPVRLGRLTPEQASLYLPIPQVPEQALPRAPVSPTFVGFPPFELNYPHFTRWNSSYLNNLGYYNQYCGSPYSGSPQYYPYSYSSMMPSSSYDGDWQVSGQGGYLPQGYYQGGFVNPAYMFNWEPMTNDEFTTEMMAQNAYEMNFSNEEPLNIHQMPSEYDGFECVSPF